MYVSLPNIVSFFLAFSKLTSREQAVFMKQQMRTQTENRNRTSREKYFILSGLLSFFRMMCKLDFLLDLIITIRTQGSLFACIDSVMWEPSVNTDTWGKKPVVLSLDGFGLVYSFREDKKWSVWCFFFLYSVVLETGTAQRQDAVSVLRAGFICQTSESVRWLLYI